MTTEVASASSRARPQSGGLRSFLSWLKRDEKLHGRTLSIDSFSSGGSDHTVTSFAFLPPTYYRYSNIEPTVIPPPGSPTHSYRKRIRDRNLRLHLDRDLTLCRKYQLIADNTDCDALSLPRLRPVKNYDKLERARRATSEFQQRRAAYVPGKRHAPPPPNLLVNSVPNRKLRKRQAPLPPTNLQVKFNKDNLERRYQLAHGISPNLKEQIKKSQFNNNCNKNKMNNSIENTNKNKNNSERNFFRQIFDTKKRTSVFDPVAVRLLPNISELDRQAAEILQSKIRNRKGLYSSNDNISTTKNETKINSHSYLKPNDNRANISKNNTKGYIDDKQELKKMLKEMKDSLPKPNTSNIKHNNLTESCIKSISTSPNHSTSSLEASTLRIDMLSDNNNLHQPINLRDGKSSNRAANLSNIKKPIENIAHSNKFECEKLFFSSPPTTKKSNKSTQILTTNKPSTSANKVNICEIEVPVIVETKQSITNNITEKLNTPILEKKIENIDLKENVTTDSSTFIVTGIERTPTEVFNANNSKSKPSSDTVCNDVRLSSSHEKRRRMLIFDLEQCIAKGDEHGAANAAMQLAQLRLYGSIFSPSLPNTNASSIPSSSKASVVSYAKTDVCDIVKELPNKHLPKITKPTEKVITKISLSNVIPDVIPSNENSIENVKLTPLNHAHKVLPQTDNNVDGNFKIKNQEDKKSKIVQEFSSTKIEPNVLATTSEIQTKQLNKIVPIEVWVEDRETARGPYRLHVNSGCQLSMLRKQAEITLGLPSRLQRWIIGRTLCTDDMTPIATLAGPELRTPFYLCLVESEINKQEANNSVAAPKVDTENTSTSTQGNVYTELVQLERCALVFNAEGFECSVCFEEYNPGEGVVLRECVHTFCKECLETAVRHCDEPVVVCPATDCMGVLQEREVRALVSPQEYEKWLARGLAAAESRERNAFHCRTRDCIGWALCDPGVPRFPCPVCKHVNCVPCQDIHEGVTCQEYRARQLLATSSNEESKGQDKDTQALLNGLIERGEALECPECNALITKKWGCDWVRCSACKTEICWVTRGRRWGPAGRGDSSAGCRCGVDGKRCHPSCGYCH